MRRVTITDRLERMMGRIADRYNANNDVPLGPAVTWADADLMQAVLELAAELDELNTRIAQLESRANE